MNLLSKTCPCNLNPQILKVQSLAAQPVKFAATQKPGVCLNLMLVTPNVYTAGMENSGVNHRCSMVTINRFEMENKW